MKTVKSLLLGSAAGLVAISGAQAADLPLAEPVDYVRICDTWGNGFHFIPGTNTCLLIGGRVRAQINYLEQHHSWNKLTGATNSMGRNRDTVTVTAPSVRVWFDARTQTEYGTLRSFIRITGNDGGALSYNQAFIQFAGLTMGRAASIYDYTEYTTFRTFGSEITGMNQFTYTATFGNGFSASLGIEDRGGREVGISATGYGGDSMPNLVGRLRVQQGWGNAQLSGAVQQLRPASAAINPGIYADTEYGFAIQGGVRVNLPSLAAGDYVYLSAAYADGAISYLGAGDVGAWNTLNGGLGLVDATTVLNLATGQLELKKSKGYNIHGGIRHFWTPQLRSNLNVGYAHIDQFGFTSDYKQWTVATNLIYSPVQNLDFGLEVFYQNISAKNGQRIGAGIQPVDTKDRFGATFRVERRF